MSEMQWLRVSSWPENPAAFLGEPENVVPQIRYRHKTGVVFERLAPGPGHNAYEVRIPCQRGEIWPVAASCWAWGGPGGYWSRLVGEAVGHDFGDAGPGTRFEESIIRFTDEQFEAVAAVVKPRRRRKDFGVSRPFGKQAAS